MKYTKYDKYKTIGGPFTSAMYFWDQAIQYLKGPLKTKRQRWFKDEFKKLVILEKKLSESLLKKVEQVEVYREKYELVEFLWEKVLSTEAQVDEGGMELIRKMIRRLDISDIESEGARKEAEENLRESSE